VITALYSISLKEYSPDCAYCTGYYGFSWSQRPLERNYSYSCPVGIISLGPPIDKTISRQKHSWSSSIQDQPNPVAHRHGDVPLLFIHSRPTRIWENKPIVRSSDSLQPRQPNCWSNNPRRSGFPFKPLLCPESALRGNIHLVTRLFSAILW